MWSDHGWRMDKAVDVHPLVTRGDLGSHGRSLQGPDPPDDGLEADAMLIHGPEFYRDLRILLLDQSYLQRQVFLKICWLAASALACCRRGTRGL